MTDKRIETYQSKQVFFDKAAMTEMTLGEDQYTIHCLGAEERWLILTLVSFYGDWVSRWSEDWTADERNQMYSNIIRRLICPVACETDVQRIADILEAQLPELTTLNGNLVTMTASLDTLEVTTDIRLLAINDTLALIKAELDTGFIPSNLVDQVELLLNAIGVILGAPSIPILP